MQEFNVGDWVWCARLSQEKVAVPCPICFTKKVVTVRLGNGDEVEVDCDYCGHGYDRSTGYVSEYMEQARPERYLITSKTVADDGREKRITYYSDHWYFEDSGNLLFATEAEAGARALELAAERKHEEETKAEFLKKNKSKSYSWNAGYHLQQARDHEAEAQRHREKARLCKARAGEE